MRGTAKYLTYLPILLGTILIIISCSKQETPTAEVVDQISFTKDSTITPQLGPPSKNAVNVDVSPILRWTDINDVLRYQIEVATDYYFKNLVYSEKILANKSIQIKDLKPSTKYYWHLRAMRNLVVSWWSDTFSFTTIPAPSLLSPINKSNNINSDPYLSWTTGDSTNTYTLEVSTNENFSTIIYTKNGLTNKVEQVNGLQKGTTYYWRVTGTNTYGTKLTSSIFSFKTAESEVPDTSACKGVKQILYEGKVYNTVAIGTQCWLKENLNVGKTVVDFGSNNGIIEKRCVGDIEDNCDKYGGAYKWGEVFNYVYPKAGKVQGICPNGWHIPSSTEFRTLISAVNNDGKALLEVGQDTGTNTSGFSAILAPGSLFSNIQAGYWSSTHYTIFDYGGNIDYLRISSVKLEVTHLGGTDLYLLWGNFVRCIKD